MNKSILRLHIFMGMVLCLYSLSSCFLANHGYAEENTTPNTQDAKDKVESPVKPDQPSDPNQQEPDKELSPTPDEKSTIGQLTKAPELLNFIDADYPESAKQEKVEAAVVMMLTLDDQGQVTDVSIQESSKSPHSFDEAAIKAAKQFKFTPAEIDGKPAPVQIAFKYEFTFTEEVSQVEQKTETGQLTGLIIEKGTKTPLPALSVKLIDRNLEQFTDAEGRFSFTDLAPGKVKIEVNDEAHYTILDLEEITAKRETIVKYYLEPKSSAGDGSITVVGRRAKKEVAKRTLTMEEIRKIPGTQGDALKVVQNLPGVARIPFGGGGLVIRGSNPGDSGSTINRHFIPLVFHFGGLRSIFPSELLESIEFYPGNFTPEFGRYTGGIVDARFRRPKKDRFHARVEADVFDAGILVEGPVSENATFAIAGRRSYIDAALGSLPEDVISFVVAPRYYDYQALYDWKKSKHRVRLYFFGSDDKLELVFNDPVENNPSVQGTLENSTSLMRLYTAWDYRISSKLSHHLSVATGQNHLEFSLGDQLSFLNDVNVVTIRDELTWKKSKQFTLRGGFEGEAYLGTIKLKLPQPTQKEGQAGGTPLSTLDIKQTERDFQFYNPGLWIEAQWKPNEDLLLLPGARVDVDSYLGDIAPDPRLNLRYTVLRDQEGKVKGTIKGGIGRYSQRPAPDETDQTYGNPNLLLEHSAHFSLGYEHSFNQNLNIDVITFYKHLYGSVSPIDDPVLRYDNNGSGRIYGLELLLRHNLTSRFFGWVSYTLMRSERKDSEDNDYRLFSLDQTHILTLIAQYKLSSQWEIGARYRYTTGNPQTPFVNAIYDTDNDVYVPVPGAVNSTRVDPFQQVDIRLDRKWIFDTWMLTAYLEIQNALNRANPEGQRYNYNFTQSQVITSLPIIPSIGLRGEL
jgi:TonB family protein